MNTNDLHVIFGAGPLGLAVALELNKLGKRVRIVNRRGKASVPPGIEVVAGDAADAASARSACRGATVVYHCANPAYSRWPQDFPAVQKGILEAASSARARLVFGDNLYSYGPVSSPLTEDLPANAQGPNGRTRARMASMLMEAHSNGLVRVAIGRASDFFGPSVLLSQVGARVFRPVLEGKPAQFLGNPDMPHTYTFINDFARALVILGDKESALGQIWHIPNAETITTRQFVELIYAEAGTSGSIKSAPRTIINILALFSPLMRALKEQFYQIDQPFVVDHSKFVRAFGDISTPHRAAIRETLEWFRQHPE